MRIRLGIHWQLVKLSRQSLSKMPSSYVALPDTSSAVAIHLSSSQPSCPRLWCASRVVFAALMDTKASSSRIVRRQRRQAGLTLRSLNMFTPTKSLQLCCNLSMTLQAGNSLLIVGPSGCGKSSLLRAIAGLCTCYSTTSTVPCK